MWNDLPPRWNGGEYQSLPIRRRAQPFFVLWPLALWAFLRWLVERGR